jgi:hypothetical protein
MYMPYWLYMVYSFRLSSPVSFLEFPGISGPLHGVLAQGLALEHAIAARAARH